MRSIAIGTLLLWAPLACSGPDDKDAPPAFDHGLLACSDDSVDGTAKDGQTCSTFRAVGGISMGGGSALRIALESPALFDAAISLGSPYIDLEYFLISVSKVSNGGFCPPDVLLPDHLAELDTKDDPNVWCGPIAFNELALPNSNCTGFEGDYNHHYRGTPAGRGGSFNRVGSLEIVQDLAIAYGNPAFYNPESSYRPPGVPADQVVPLELAADDQRSARDARRQRICDTPTVLEGRSDRVFNPRGEYPMITFCDGDGPITGEYEPGTAYFPVEVALAVDYNRNGRRDYAEPVVAQSMENLFDFGSDGVPDTMEPGYDAVSNPDPAHDNYDWYTNPRGSELNLRYDEGERYDDYGLDGVAATGDYGEANGRYDLNPNIEYTFSRSPRRLIEQLDDRMLDRLHIYADAGIRDFLLSSQITNQFWGSLRARRPDSRLYSDWSDLAATAQGPGRSYDPSVADLREDKIGRHAYLRYGDPSVCPGVDEELGRGNHVGTAQEALNRILTSVAFASARWADGDFRELPGSLADQGSPNGSLSDFVVVDRFDSQALGRSQPYVVILPPDYFERPDGHYPVMYFLHGQGQKATDLAASALLLLSPQMGSRDSAKQALRQSDWQKLILVFADGECQVGECHTGTFYMDHKGLNGDGPKHGEAFFELMRLVDSRYRTKAPRMFPKPQ